jgi:hypothetical protein
MPYTLKLDWAYERAKAAAEALLRADLDELADDLAGLVDWGKPGDDATLKLDWNATEINAARYALGAEILRLQQGIEDVAYSNRPEGTEYADLVADWNQIWAARRDIETYLVTSASLSEVSRHALAWRPL